MKNNKFLFLLLFLLIFGYEPAAMTSDEEEFDVDQADSLDFENFHKPKKGAIKIYNAETGEFLGKKRQQTEKVYPNKARLKPITAAINTDQLNNEETVLLKGKRFGIRQRFTIGQSDKTTADALTAINTLHRKMANRCPAGWIKQKEWTVLINTAQLDYYLHYEFECL